MKSISDDIKKIDRWFLFRAITIEDKEVILPYQPNAKPAVYDLPETLCSYSEAIEAVKSGHFHGIGFIDDTQKEHCWRVAGTADLVGTTDNGKSKKPPKNRPQPPIEPWEEHAVHPAVAKAIEKSRAAASTGEILDASPPHDIDVEKCVLASMILDDSQVHEVLKIIKPADFYWAAHQTIMRAIVSLHEAGSKIDAVLVVAQLKKLNEFDSIGGSEYLCNIINSIGIPQYGIYYARIVAELARRRSIINSAIGILRDSYDTSISETILKSRLEALSQSEIDHADKFPCYSIQELAHMNLQVKYIFERGLVAGVPGVIGGREKSLKTSIALDCAISMATGTDWLRHFKCLSAARCIYFFGEGGLIDILDKASRIARSKGFDLDVLPLGSLFICLKVPSLTSREDLKTVAGILQDHEAEFAFFDPQYLMMGDSHSVASNVYAMGAMLRAIMETCNAVGVTPIVCHHFRKTTNPNGIPELSDLSQAGAAEFAGQWMLVNRASEYNEDNPGEHDLIVRIGSRVGYSDRWAVHVTEGDVETGRVWMPSVIRYKDAKTAEIEAKAAKRREKMNLRAEGVFQEARERIVMVLMREGRPRTFTDVRPLIGRSKDVAAAAWQSLLDDGSIISAGKEYRGCRRVDVFNINTTSD